MNIGWNAPRGKKKIRYLNPVLAMDETGRPCRRCHDDAGKCTCAADCGVLVCTGAKEESDGDGDRAVPRGVGGQQGGGPV